MISQSRWFRFLVLPFSLLWLLICVFWGGFPLKDYLIDAVLDPRLALAFFVLCFLISRDFHTRISRSHIEEAGICLLIFSAAAYMRLHALSYAGHMGPSLDEPLVVEPVRNMIGKGTLDYERFEYGGVYFYVLMGLFLVYFIHLTSRFTVRVFSDIPSSSLYSSARYATALLGTATVAVTYGVARKHFGRAAGIIASLLLAFSALNYGTGQQVRIDIPLTLFVITAHYFLLEMLSDPSALNYAMAGVFCGLAVGTKYTSLPIVFSLILTHFLASKRKFDWNLILGLIFTAGIFLLFNFEIVLHPNHFVSRVPFATYHLNPEHWSSTSNRALVYFRDIANEGIGAFGIVFALLSLLAVLYRKDHRFLVLWCFPILYFMLISSYPSGFPRYVLPILPNLAVLAGYSGNALYEWASQRLTLTPRARWALGTGFVLLICIRPLWNAAQDVYEERFMLQPATVVEWVEQNIPPKSAIIADPTGPILPDDQYDIRQPQYREFRMGNLNVAKGEYLVVTQDLFATIPAECVMIKEFPSQVRGRDRSIRIYQAQK